MEQVYMTTDVWVFPLEPLDNRYTKQWYDEIPRLLQERLDLTNHTCYQAVGQQMSDTTTSGAFLDFADTNYWKSTQLADFVKGMQAGHVSDDAVILFTDFWNPVITQIAYMRDLLDKDWKLHSIAHAGAYDPSDILGYKMRKPWPEHAERSWFYACDVTYFASNFHRDMFLRNLNIPSEYHHRAVLSGQPHNAIIEKMETISNNSCKPIDIIWPHRYNADKQPDIIEDLTSDFDIMITQKHQFSKDEYYTVLADSKVIFSCALHENLGISVMEGVLVGAIPLLPDRCSYAEMYLDEFKYPSEWTENFDSYIKNRDKLTERLNSMIQDPDAYQEAMHKQKQILISNYLTSDIMIDRLTSSSNKGQTV